MVPEYTKRAQQNYMSKKTQIHITLNPEDKEEIQKRAEKEGLSMTQYILQKCLDRS